MRTVYRRSIMCLSAGVCILLGLGLLIHPDGGANVSAEAPGVAAAADRKPATASVQLPEATYWMLSKNEPYRERGVKTGFVQRGVSATKP